MIDKLYETALAADKKSFSTRLDRKSLDRDVFESSIDFPRVSLDPTIWSKEDGNYTLRKDVKRKVLDVLKKYPDVPLLEIAKEIHIVGSSCTNQYLDTADLDTHIIPKSNEGWSEEKANKVIKWFNTNRDKIGGYVGTHPVEVYIQLDPNQDLMSDGCYDLLRDKWLVGPKIVSMSTDPYEDFSHIAQDIRDAVEDADELFGELKRDIIDYDVIKQAMERMSGQDKERLMQKLRGKLKELEINISALYSKRGEWVDARRKASKPESPESALKDVELAKNWKDINAQFKFINRYQYLRTISSLQKLLDDGEVTSNEIGKIKDIMGTK